MSSKSYKIMKAIEPPVLSVAGRITTIKRVLVCSGGKHYIDAAVQLTGQIARGMKAAVTLLHVLPKPPAIYAGLPGMEETLALLLRSPSELGINLRHEKEVFEALAVPVEVRLRRGAVLQEILREIRSGSYDLIVTGSAPSRSFRTYVLGNISREIVNRTDCAVLVARSQPPLGGVPGLGALWGRLAPH